jgi:hemolysin activation/secretion protein
MSFARNTKAPLRVLFGLLHFALALWALTMVCTAFAAEDNENVENSAESTATERRFDIWEYRVEGNTLLEARQIEAAVYPYLGPQRLIADVNEAASNLERAFKEAGYPVIFVEVPEQDVLGGVVTLKVVQGAVARVRVSEARYFTPSGIRASLPSLETGAPLHVPSMQRDMNALNARSQDLKVAPILSQGKEPGTVDVELRVKDSSPLHGSLDINNYHSADTSPSRIGASLSYDNLWQMQHSLALQYQIAPENTDEVKVLVATYMMPLPDSEKRLAFYAIDSKSDVATVSDTNVIGEGSIYGARMIMPLRSTRSSIRSLTLGFDYKDFDEIIRLDTEASDLTPISYGMWSLQYAALMPGSDSTSKFSIAANFGIRGAFNSDSEFAFKRFNGKSNFAYLSASYDRLDYLSGDWQTHISGEAQLANSALVNNEQFSAGGANSVRGYYQSQRLADNGLRIGLELLTPSFSGGEWLNEARLLAFLEGAHLEVVDALPQQDERFDLLSTGLGLRMKSPFGFDLRFDWGYPLKDSGDVEKGDAHSHVGLQYAF